MAEKLDKLVKEVKVELSEARLAWGGKSPAGEKACLLHAKDLLSTYLRKEHGYG